MPSKGGAVDEGGLFQGQSLDWVSSKGGGACCLASWEHGMEIAPAEFQTEKSKWQC